MNPFEMQIATLEFAALACDEHAQECKDPIVREEWMRLAVGYRQQARQFTEAKGPSCLTDKTDKTPDEEVLSVLSVEQTGLSGEK